MAEKKSLARYRALEYAMSTHQRGFYWMPLVRWNSELKKEIRETLSETYGIELMETEEIYLFVPESLDESSKRELLAQALREFKNPKSDNVVVKQSYSDR